MSSAASTAIPPGDIDAALASAQRRVTTMPLTWRWFASVSSTMDVAGDAAEAGAPEGLVVLADAQTQGRGRRGRTWDSPPGVGLYLSLLLRPSKDWSDPAVSLLTLAAGVGVRAALAKASGVEADLKWPNDVMSDGLKIAGILAEGRTMGAAMQAVVLGVGVNVGRGSEPVDPARGATSLEALVGRPVSRGAVLEELLIALAAQCDALRRGHTDDILRSWRAASPSAVGRPVTWTTRAGSARRGVTAGIDDAGALRIATAAGLDRVVAGELRWE
ncbi:MAG: biotin--[acetyl-CoA-carboxylase] ligase [Acidobacteriota bacterium]